MGKRTVTLPEAADHSEITRLLFLQYPKLECLTGGWLLYKALGGSGQRKLTLISPEAEGYNGQFLKAATIGGKNIIYILPLQEELDTTPRPLDAQEFQKMPKATCQTCGSPMPLQVLALHVKSCLGRSSSEEDLHERSSPEVMVVSEFTSKSTAGPSNASKSSAEVMAASELIPESRAGPSNTSTSSTEVCPVCLIQYPVDYIQVHASTCGESADETFPCMLDVSEPKGKAGIKSLDDVLQAITAAVTTDGKTFDIKVSRYNMLERGLTQWQRPKKSSPANQLKVTFIEEVGVDTGALRKEFLTGMMEGIEKRFFEKGTHGRRPKYSLSDLDKGHFKTVGEIMAASLAQGGPAPNFLMRWCYKSLCSGSLEYEDLGKHDVEDGKYADLLSKVESATESTLQDLTEDILNCGYTGSICLAKTEEIVRAIVLHANLKLLPILQQIRSGLQLYGLCDLMAKHPDACEPLFVPGEEEMTAEFSEKGTNRERVEVTIMNHLQDLLQETEEVDLGENPPGVEETAPPSLSPRSFLQWVTGQGHIPVMQQEKSSFKLAVRFNHHCVTDYGEHRICYPTVAACSKTITFPVKHMQTYDEFKLVLVEAFSLGQQFLNV